jgi:cation diffusion facilitator CzcD-associated flavoprotein CzcO
MHPPVDTLVIGAGQAGLAADYHLQRANGAPPLYGG